MIYENYSTNDKSIGIKLFVDKISEFSNFYMKLTLLGILSSKFHPLTSIRSVPSHFDALL